MKTMIMSDQIGRVDTVFVPIIGPRKFLADVCSVAEIKLRVTARNWYWFTTAAIMFPLPMFILAFTLVQDDPAAVSRVVAGTLVYGISFATANMLGQSYVIERFNGTLKFMITMPLAKSAYVAGSSIHASIIGTLTVLTMLAFGVVSGTIDSTTWTFFPVIVLTVLSLVGLTLLIVGLAPSQIAGNMMANTFGIILVVISPVYFTMDQAPGAVRWLGYISPVRYAADGLTASLQGRADIGTELIVLSAFAVVAMALGLWRLPWQESQPTL